MKQLFRFAVCAALCLALVAANLCVNAAAAGFYAKAEMLQIKSHIESDAELGQYTPVQGACTDGKYAYFALMQGGATILKYDLSTWELVDQEQITNVGHANDMTYNSAKKQLVIANNAPYYDIVTLVDPDTLQVIEDVKLKYKIYSIAYNATHDEYVVGISGGYDFAILDKEFKKVEKYEGVNTGYTRQGCDCDDDYIYFVQSGGNNVVAIYDYFGKHVATVPMTVSTEAENIFHVGSDFYVSTYYYGSSVYRVGFSDATRITYEVRYDPGGGTGVMTPTEVHYGTSTKLRKNTFTRPGYFFGGWCAERSCDGKVYGYRNNSTKREWLKESEVYDAALYRDEEKVAKTVKFGSVTMTAFWIANEYDVKFDSDGGEGSMEAQTVGYYADYALPEPGFTREGYIFDGYTAARDYDGRVYGYRKKSDQPEWLKEKDAAKRYVFKPGEVVSSLTYGGSVTFTARFRFAYTYNDEGDTLLSYVGVDETVRIPTNGGRLTAVAAGAFSGNEPMRELRIPAGVTAMQDGAVADCPNLKDICFEGRFPESFDDRCVQQSITPIIYREFNGQAFCVGFFGDSACAPLIRCQAEALEKNILLHQYER